jgi:hypothetical protein
MSSSNLLADAQLMPRETATRAPAESLLLTTKEVAKRLDINPVTLDKWRTRKARNEGTARKVVPLPFVKIGGKVRYLLADVEAFIVARRVVPGEPDEPPKRRKRRAA